VHPRSGVVDQYGDRESAAKLGAGGGSREQGAKEEREELTTEGTEDAEKEIGFWGKIEKGINGLRATVFGPQSWKTKDGRQQTVDKFDTKGSCDEMDFAETWMAGSSGRVGPGGGVGVCHDEISSEKLKLVNFTARIADIDLSRRPRTVDCRLF